MVNEALRKGLFPLAFHSPLTKKTVSPLPKRAKRPFRFTICYLLRGWAGAIKAAPKRRCSGDREMDGLFGEGSLIVRFVVAFVIVLGLIGATFWIIRRFGGARVGAAAQRGRQPRLAVIDAAAVDGRRRLVLVRRDNVEHLLMIG